ncbi:MAG: hypothetical protein JWP27_3083 [Flaviaesturariibacter sp.]|nr:hypothetical protein [Flaviaesturariibacter sp.]
MPSLIPCRTIAFFILLSCAGSGANAQDSSLTTSRFVGRVIEERPAHRKSFLFKAGAGATYIGACFLAYKFIDPDLQEDTQERLTPFEQRSARLISPLGLGSTNWIA